MKMIDKIGRSKTNRLISEFVILMLAVVGLVSIAAPVFTSILNVATSMMFLILSVIGVLIAFNIGHTGKFDYRNMNLWLAIGLIVGGILLYNFVPVAAPPSFSVIAIGG